MEHNRFNGLTGYSGVVHDVRERPQENLCRHRHSKWDLRDCCEVDETGTAAYCDRRPTCDDKTSAYSRMSISGFHTTSYRYPSGSWHQPSKGVRGFGLWPSSEAPLRARVPGAKKASHTLHLNYLTCPPPRNGDKLEVLWEAAHDPSGLRSATRIPPVRAGIPPRERKP